MSDKIKFMEVLEAHGRKEFAKHTNALKKHAAKEVTDRATDVIQKLLLVESGDKSKLISGDPSITGR